jgi:hypothetical protein
MSSKLLTKTETNSLLQIQSSRFDPLLFNSEWGSSLFVGVSGTGKTTLMLAALNRHLQLKQLKPKKIYCLNTRGNEYDQLGGQSASVERISSLPKRSFLVLEDVIELGKKNEVLLRKTLNVNLHHRSQKLFAATHSNVKTNLWSNIQYFDNVIFPAEKSNHVNFRSIINIFRLGKESAERFTGAFLEQCGKKPKRYIILDVKNICVYAAKSLEAMIANSPNCYSKIAQLEGEISSSEMAEVDSQKEVNLLDEEKNLSSQFENIIKGYKYRARASAAYSLLEKCVLKKFEMTPDLVVHIGKVKNREGKIKISIVDYIQFLVDPDSGQPPWKYVTFHKFVCEKCHVPKLIVQNPAFSKLLS